MTNDYTDVQYPAIRFSCILQLRRMYSHIVHFLSYLQSINWCLYLSHDTSLNHGFVILSYSISLAHFSFMILFHKHCSYKSWVLIQNNLPYTRITNEREIFRNEVVKLSVLLISFRAGNSLLLNEVPLSELFTRNCLL